MALKQHGITPDTTKNLLFSTLVLYKDLKYKENAWSGTILGATSGGAKLSITPEYTPIELDGAWVKAKGSVIKSGETGTLEGTFTELSENLIVESLHLVEDTSGNVAGYKKYVTKEAIEDDDYYENVAGVGTLTDGRQVVIILGNALCTSALELDTKNKTQNTYALTFESHASLDGSLKKLPIEIYYQSAQAV